MPYRLINVFCRLAGNLAPEREAFYQAVGECNEKEGMPRGLLLTPLSIGSYGPDRKNAVDSNIGVSECFLLVVEDIWDVSVQSFLHDYRLALKCRAGDTFPMREVTVLVKKTPAGDEPADLTRFRAELKAEGAPRHFEFTTVEEFHTLLAPLLSLWLAGVEAAGAAGS